MDLAVHLLGWSSGLLGATIRHMRLLRSQSGGQRGLNSTGTEESRRRRDLTVERSRRNSGEAGSGLRGKEFGEHPGATAKLLRGLARAKGQRSDGTTAARSLGPAMARRRWLWGAEAALERRGSAQGWSRGLIKGGAGIWACVPTVSTARIAAVIRAGKPDRATSLRYPGLGQGNFWKATGAGRLASGSMRKRGVERGHGAARVRAERSGELGRERSSRRRRRV